MSVTVIVTTSSGCGNLGECLGGDSVCLIAGNSTEEAITASGVKLGDSPPGVEGGALAPTPAPAGVDDDTPASAPTHFPAPTGVEGISVHEGAVEGQDATISPTHESRIRRKMLTTTSAVMKSPVETMGCDSDDVCVVCTMWSENKVLRMSC